MAASSASKPGSPPTIAIMNGSARSATPLAQLALASGSHVHLIVRAAKRVDRALTEPQPSPNLHVHELPDIFSPSALRPILAEADYVVLTFVPPMEAAVQATRLNQDGAIAAVSAIMAGTTSGAPPRTRVILVSSATVHPDNHGLERSVLTRLMPAQYADLERTQAYLAQQAAWGLQWVSVNPGMLVEVAAAEPEAVQRDGVRVAASVAELGGRKISYGRLGGAFLQVMADWDRWQGRAVVPVPLSDAITGASELPLVLRVTAKRLLKTATWWAALLAVGWQVGSRFGDLGTGAWLHGLSTGGRWR